MKKNLIRLAKHVGFIVSLSILIGVLSFYALDFYTGHHDETIKVPSVEDLRIDKAVRLLEQQGFRYQITDTVFRDGKELMSIVAQNPPAGLDVKKGRCIYLVLNSQDLPMIPMPDLAGKTSFQLALKMLKSKGLELGEKIERPDPSILTEDDEPVLEQRISGQAMPIEPGTPVRMHSKIDLVVAVKPGSNDSLPLDDEGSSESSAEF
jgi:eukaryotic-like serine/threonine-protein kinase